MIQLRPAQSDLPRLKEPLGKLIPGEPRETMPALKILIERYHPTRVTAVGDVVSRETLAAGIPVHLRIIDHISMRKPATSFSVMARKSYHARNPAGVITQESWDMIKQAMKEEDALILVDGEEGRLTLPCIVESPPRAMILYGQPREGLVVVDVTPNIRRETTQILGRMIREETNQP